MYWADEIAPVLFFGGPVKNNRRLIFARSMSTWRKKAIDCAPELKTLFQDPALTPYTVFSELMPLLRAAHRQQNTERLHKIYEFAAWCHHSNSKDLWNAAGVSFYEHLTDTDDMFPEFTKWVSKEIYADIRGLLDRRTSDAQMKILDAFYGYRNKG